VLQKKKKKKEEEEVQQSDLGMRVSPSTWGQMLTAGLCSLPALHTVELVGLQHATADS
jgi:hypothetical protein